MPHNPIPQVANSIVFKYEATRARDQFCSAKCRYGAVKRTFYAAFRRRDHYRRGRQLGEMMRTALTILGVLIAIAGLIWAAQGAGWFPYPRESFMIDNSRWIYIGLATVVGGVIVIVLARR
jgi:hypothetical protein